MVMWRVDRLWGVPNICEVEVDRATEKTVYFKANGRETRENKTSEYHCWFDSWDDAKSWCVQFATAKVDGCKMALTKAEDILAAIQALKEGE